MEEVSAPVEVAAEEAAAVEAEVVLVAPEADSARKTGLLSPNSAVSSRVASLALLKRSTPTPSLSRNTRLSRD